MSEPALTSTDRRTPEDRRSGDPDRRRSRGGLIPALMVVDALVLGLIIFFAVVGGAASSAPLTVAAIVAAVVLAVYSLLRLRRQAELTPADRRIRERRGF